jgi:hypothetical protein
MWKLYSINTNRENYGKRREKSCRGAMVLKIEEFD